MVFSLPPLTILFLGVPCRRARIHRIIFQPSDVKRHRLSTVNLAVPGRSPHSNRDGLPNRLDLQHIEPSLPNVHQKYERSGLPMTSSRNALLGTPEFCHCKSNRSDPFNPNQQSIFTHSGRARSRRFPSRESRSKFNAKHPSAVVGERLSERSVGRR